MLTHIMIKKVEFQHNKTKGLVYRDRERPNGLK